MAAHANRVLTRSAARTLVRLSAAAVLALVVCGAVMSLRRPQTASPTAGAGLSASLVSGSTAWAAVTGGAEGSEAAASLSGSGADPGALMHEVCLGRIWIYPSAILSHPPFS